MKQSKKKIAPNFTQLEDQQEVILTHFGRSGSTVLTTLLAQHDKVEWMGEVFTLIKDHTPDEYNFSVDQMLEIVNKKKINKQKSRESIYFGYEIKLINFLQNPSADMVDYVARLTDPNKYIHVVLRRRNILRRVLSAYKAMITKVYHVKHGHKSQAARSYKFDMKKLYDFDTGQYGDTLVELISNVHKREESVLNNYKKLKLNYLELNYEDHISSDPRLAYHLLLDYLGLEYQHAEIKLDKTSKDIRSEIINYSEVKQALLGTEYEWMILS